MPSLYHCSHCKLGFESGWFHYFRSHKSDFGAETRLVCKQCGTAHRVEHAICAASDRVSGQDHPLTVPPDPETYDRLVLASADKLRFMLQGISRDDPSYSKLELEVLFVELLKMTYGPWRECARRSNRSDGPIVGYRVGARLDLTRATCNHCLALASLVEWDDANSDCPRCQTPHLRFTGEYVT
jgi:hypothetical protein